jgi:hypothetical protein
MCVSWANPSFALQRVSTRSHDVSAAKKNDLRAYSVMAESPFRMAPGPKRTKVVRPHVRQWHKELTLRGTGPMTRPDVEGCAHTRGMNGMR